MPFDPPNFEASADFWSAWDTQVQESHRIAAAGSTRKAPGAQPRTSSPTYKRLHTLPNPEWENRKHWLFTWEDERHWRNCGADDESIYGLWRQAFEYATSFGVDDWTHPSIAPYLPIRHLCYGERRDLQDVQDHRERDLARDRQRRKRARDRAQGPKSDESL